MEYLRKFFTEHNIQPCIEGILTYYLPISRSHHDTSWAAQANQHYYKQAIPSPFSHEEKTFKKIKD